MKIPHLRSSFWPIISMAMIVSLCVGTTFPPTADGAVMALLAGVAIGIVAGVISAIIDSLR